jgi:hypothetical protein
MVDVKFRIGIKMIVSTSTTLEWENRVLCCQTYSARMTLHGQTNIP